MGYNLKQTKRALLNKWDWENPEYSIPLFIWGPIGIGKTSIVEQAVIERKKKDLQKIMDDNRDNRVKVGVYKDQVTRGMKWKSDNSNRFIPAPSDVEKNSYTLFKEAERKLKRLDSYNRTSEVQDILDENLLVLRLAERPIEQLQGVPTPNFKQRVTMFFMPENMVNVSKADWVVVFLDELDKADEWKMAAATHLIESKRIGEFSFPKDTYVVCAGNRVEDSWISKEVVPELKNRGAHIDVEIDLDIWLSWAVKTGIRADIVAFHRYAKALGKNFLAVYEEGANNFATPRTWHYSSIQANKVEKRGVAEKIPTADIQAEIFDEVEQLIGKTVGDYKAYVTVYRNVDINGILNGTIKIPKFDNKTSRINILSKQYIYAMGLCEQITLDHLKEEARLNNFITALESFIGEARTIMFMMLNANKKEIIDKIGTIEAGDKLIDEYFKSMDSSNLK